MIDNISWAHLLLGMAGALVVLVLIGVICALIPNERREAGRAYTALVFQIWEAQTRYLDLQAADGDSCSPQAVTSYERESRLRALLTAAQEHRETGRAWLSLGKLGSYSVHQQALFGLAALANFRAEADFLTQDC